MMGASSLQPKAGELVRYWVVKLCASEMRQMNVTDERAEAEASVDLSIAMCERDETMGSRGGSGSHSSGANRAVRRLLQCDPSAEG